MSRKYMSRICLLLLPLLLGSCSKWLDVNTDPNNPTEVAPELVLPAAEASIAGVIGGDFAIIGGLWSQHWTQSNVSSQYKTIDSYAMNPSDMNIQWTEMYAGAINDLERIKTQANEAQNWNLFLQAEVLQVYAYEMFAAFFDKIPFTEAVKGEDNLKPVYDEGPVVYDGLITRLDAALAKDFSAPTVTAVTTDLIFPGSASVQVDKWTRFANTLKLKIYMRQTESSRSAQALAGINALLDSGAPFLEEDAAITQFIDEANRSNPLYETNVRQLNVATNLRLSRTFESYLKANNDLTRLNGYFTPGSTGQVGLVQGNFEALTTVVPGAVPSPAKFSPTTPFYFMSYDEALFLQAEAALRTGKGDAQALYNAAVEAAYGKFGFAFDPSVLDAGGAYAYPSGGSAADQLKAIIVQKWVAMVNQGYESFLDQARTGYPEISPVPATDENYEPGEWTYSITGVTSGAFPKRLLFPAVSSDVNEKAPAVVPITTKVWWMK